MIKYISYFIVFIIAIFIIIYTHKNIEKTYLISYVVIKGEVQTVGRVLLSRSGMFAGKIVPEYIFFLERDMEYTHNVDKCIVINVTNLGYSVINNDKEDKKDKEKENKKKRGPRLMK